MIRIGVCDDLAEDLYSYRKMVQDIMMRLHLNAEVMCFQSGEELLWEIEQKGSMDMILMDIAMKGMNGVETARIIRETDYKVILIFISLHDQYCKEMISVQPFAFIDKPVSENELEKVIAHAVTIKEDSGEIFLFSNKKVIYRLSLRKIRYFESNKRQIYIHTIDDEEYSFYKKLDDVERNLKDSNTKFIRVNKSFLVNVFYIKEFRYEKIIMDDGTELGIGVKYRESVKCRYIEFMRMH